VTKAASIAYQMAGKQPAHIQLCEVHDCFTVAELMAYENLGFCKPGEGGKLIEEDQLH
jgi:acetyl-CoA C-acetyltransferase